jgi:hypothetical protein
MAEPVVVATRADLRMHLVADLPPSFERRLVSHVVRNLHRPVEGDPAHHLRVGEVPAWPAHLPNALVRLPPALFERVQQQEHE